jgi:hypothetical protein
MMAFSGGGSWYYRTTLRPLQAFLGNRQFGEATGNFLAARTSQLPLHSLIEIDDSFAASGYSTPTRHRPKT